jgi:hypothetical protein
MDQEPCFQVAKFVFKCMEYRQSEECEDCEPYFDLSLFGEDWQGQVYDTFSSDLRGVLRSHILLLRMVLVFLPMEHRWLRPGAPLVGPICNLFCKHTANFKAEILEDAIQDTLLRSSASLVIEKIRSLLHDVDV